MIGDKQYTEALDASFASVVGERSHCVEAVGKPHSGVMRSEDADMSSDKTG
jgi:hypothetical protein